MSTVITLNNRKASLLSYQIWLGLEEQARSIVHYEWMKDKHPDWFDSFNCELYNEAISDFTDLLEMLNEVEKLNYTYDEKLNYFRKRFEKEKNKEDF